MSELRSNVNNSEYTRRGTLYVDVKALVDVARHGTRETRCPRVATMCVCMCVYQYNYRNFILTLAPDARGVARDEKRDIPRVFLFPCATVSRTLLVAPAERHNLIRSSVNFPTKYQGWMLATDG